MITLKEIKERTLYEVTIQGSNKILTEEESKVYKKESINRISPLSWEYQPKEIQPFWKSYEYAIDTLERKDLCKLSDFYEEWVNNPNEFKPGYSKSIGMIPQLLNDIDESAFITIENYDGIIIGTHHCGDFKESLDILDLEFEVIRLEEVDSDEYNITIQEDNKDTIRDFEYKSNAIAIDHDKYLGDGKYWKN